MASKWLLAISGWLLLLAPAIALTVEAPLPDAVQEARAKALFHEIRCVVCQGESIAESPADVARDVRQVIRQHIKNGESDKVIIDYLVSRYGKSILMKPPMETSTLLLWFGPWLILAMACMMTWRYFKKPA